MRRQLPTLHEWYEQRDKAVALEERLIRALRILVEVARCQPAGPMERQIWYEVYKIIDDEADWYMKQKGGEQKASP